MSKTDRRVKRTHQALSEALIALTEEQGYESITIRDLTDRAEIGYATFFRHYKSKDELLLDMLTGLIEEVIERLPDLSVFSEAFQKGRIVFEFVDENTDICRVLLGSQGSLQMSRQLQLLATERSIQMMRESLGQEQPVDIVANHIVASVFALVRWWLDNDKPHPPETMARFYSDLVVAPAHAILQDFPA